MNKGIFVFILRWLGYFKKFLLSYLKKEDKGKTDNSLVEIIDRAKEEWLDAGRIFEEVTDPMLIDYAVYQLKASEKKYMYLIKIAKKENNRNYQIRIF